MKNETAKNMSEFETLFKEREAIENYMVIIPFISFFLSTFNLMSFQIGIEEETGRVNQNTPYDLRISRLISLWFDNGLMSN